LGNYTKKSIDRVGSDGEDPVTGHQDGLWAMVSKRVDYAGPEGIVVDDHDRCRREIVRQSQYPACSSSYCHDRRPFCLRAAERHHKLRAVA
jgi:hypothetical protein